MDAAKPVKTAAPAAVPAPNLNSTSKLAILHPNGHFRLGSDGAELDRIFVSPPGAFAFNDLPRGFQPPYRVRGWENGDDGFGAIFYQNEPVLVLLNDVITKEELDEVRKKYEAEFGKPKVELLGARTNYWFWEENAHRLMINSVTDSKEKAKLRLTIALGERAVMDAIRSNPDHARADQGQFERGIERVRNPG